MHHPKTTYLGDPYSPLDLSLINNEMGLLLAAARVSLGLADHQTIAQHLCKPLDWSLVLTMANWHRLHPALNKMFYEGKHEGIPLEVLQTLKEGLNNNALRNLKLMSLLFKILAEFKKSNIPVLLIKGLALAGPVYGDMALRRSGDLDLMVNPQDVRKAMNLICNLEYCSTQPLNEGDLSVLFATDNEMKLQVGGELVELQWRLAPIHTLYPATWEELFKEAECFDLAGHQVPTLGAMEVLPYLCFHGTKHFWYRLFWLMDVAACFASNKMGSWNEICSRSEVRGQKRSLLLGLALSRHLLGTPLPAEAMAELFENPAIGQRITFLRNSLLPRKGRDYSPNFSQINSLKNVFWMNPGLSIKGSIIWRYIFQPNMKDREAIPLSKFLSPLYYVIRPIRLAFSLFKESSK